jgi:hypothetical protein
VAQYNSILQFFCFFSLLSLDSERTGVFIQNDFFLNELRNSMDNHKNRDVSSCYIVFSKRGKKLGVCWLNQPWQVVDELSIPFLRPISLSVFPERLLVDYLIPGDSCMVDR